MNKVLKTLIPALVLVVILGVHTHLVCNSSADEFETSEIAIDNTARDIAEIKSVAVERLRRGGFEIVGYMGFQILDGQVVVYYNVKFIGQPDMKLHQVYLKKAYNEIMIYDKGIKE